MKTILIIAGVVLIAMFIAWLVYNKRLQMITQMYKEIAEKQGGEVETGGLSLHPKLKLWYKGTPVLISYAFTGTLADKPGYYTFAQFGELPKPCFKFRIVPTAKMDQKDYQFMKHKMQTEIRELDEYYTVSSNRPEQLKAFLTPAVVNTLLEWTKGPEANGIEDIHILDDKLVFSISGIPQEQAVYQKVLDSAKEILDAYLAANLIPGLLKNAAGY